MVRNLGGLMALGAAAALIGCAPAAQPQGAMAGRQCFLAAQVNGFNAIDDDTVHVTVGVNDVYELEIAGACPEIDWSNRIGIRSTGGNSWVCRGFDAELLVPSPIGLDHCPVLDVRRLSPEEIAAARASRS